MEGGAPSLWRIVCNLSLANILEVLISYISPIYYRRSNRYYIDKSVILSNFIGIN